MVKRYTQGAMPDSKYKPPYPFSVTIGETCARQMRTFHNLAEKLKMPVEDLMRQANGHAPPSKALVKGLSKELGIDEKLLEKLADAVRQDLG
jgi:ribosome-binding protein aMBF1 (putative translation factor)